MPLPFPPPISLPIITPQHSPPYLTPYTTTPTQTLSSLCWCHHHHPSSQLVGTLHAGTLCRGHRPWWTPQSVCYPRCSIHIWGCCFLQGVPYLPKRTSLGMVHLFAAILHRLFRHPLQSLHHPLRTKSPSQSHATVPPQCQTEKRRDAKGLHRLLRQSCPPNGKLNPRNDLAMFDPHTKTWPIRRQHLS